MKVCECLNCGMIMIDENPSSDSKDYPDNETTNKMLRITKDHYNYDGDEFWACPACETDSNLIDK